ncbi:UDP-3-O-(3-hydroxymyristoyl)glucosamine N-acyltransferase [Aeoliella sp. ICT_H6.2]|uniref:UDP-3-O-acylglucosamine N-acyltransferase n=1 Tax=Aeoliella straminimaris TaxID=2954799 RepID=A0A9X2JHD6_9BACT|nr:UDP-3-O-(3-hydroxymyristoyl)glucosamine N-acyltransferase [Aeoliella straminimaris]MCO6042809.1 UDP-3-O-(3-hydroxymyristoyl)glucosamine N-acyltransferase [Aeoliella straminimaris]
MTELRPRTLSDLAHLVAGRTTGDATVTIVGAAPLDEVAPRQITLIDQPERLAQAAQSPAGAVLVPTGLTCQDKPTIEVDDVHAAFATIVKLYRPHRCSVAPGVATSASVSDTAKLAEGVTIGAGATVADDVTIGPGATIHAGVHIMAGCQIGAGVTIFPAVTLYENTVVGDHAIIHSGAVIGAYGFGYRQSQGRHELSAQLGNVVIGPHVEVGANSTIDRGTYSSTRIGEGTKIDNLVQIAHNCQIGKHNLLCAQVGIAGSTTTGDYVVMAGQVGVRDHVHIGEGARIGAMAGVSNDIAAGVVAFGAPATPERDQKILLASLAKLPEMRKQFKQIRKSVQNLESSARQHGSQGGRAAMDPAA